jgi:hypothetical protein
MAKNLTVATVQLDDEIIDDGSISASLRSKTGYLSQIRDLVIQDNKGVFNPFGSNGVFSGSDWRNKSVIETDSETELDIFNGSLSALLLQKGRRGFTLKIKAVELLATRLKTKVTKGTIFDKNTATGLSKFQVNGNQPINDNVIKIDTGTGEITKPAFVSFGTDIEPSYEIIETTETASDTTEITLNKGIERDLTDGTELRILVPIEKTIPEEIKQALTDIGLSSRLDNTFDNLHNTESAASRKLKILIRSEQNIDIAKYISELLKLGNYYLITNQAGTLSLIKGLQYQNDGNILEEIGEDDILLPYSFQTDFSKAVLGYSLLYQSGDIVLKAEANASQALIDKWDLKEIYAPINYKSEKISDYMFLYNSLATATHYGAFYLSENAAPRYIIKAGLKAFQSQNTKHRREIALAQEYNLTIKKTFDEKYQREPVAVYSYRKNERTGKYNEVEFMLLNTPIEQVSLSREFTEKPVIQKVLGVNGGVVLLFDSIGSTKKIEVSIYTYDGTKRILIEKHDRSGDVQTETSTIDYLKIEDVLLVNESTYYLKASLINGSYKSNLTKLFRFVPSNRTIDPGDTYS